METALRELCAEREFFPTAAELEAAGRHDVRMALKKFGGHAEWAQRLGLPLRPGQDRTPYGAEDAVRDARLLMAELGPLPNMHAVRAHGYPRLASYIKLHHRGSVKDFLAARAAQLR